MSDGLRPPSPSQSSQRTSFPAPEIAHLGALQIRASGKTDVGMKRSQNQDSLATETELGLFMVADGMGGHQGGETASRMAVELISNLVCQRMQDESWDPKTTLIQSITTASQEIYKKANETPTLKGMGTTSITLLLKGSTAHIGHVGDSRCYLLRQETLWQLTRDHSLVQEKVRAGLITREAAKNDRSKNVITRCVGFEAAVQVDHYQIQLHEGDLFLLCSDGLSGLVEDLEIQSILLEEAKHEKNLNDTVHRLVSTANENGGDDNVSVVLVQILKTKV